MEQRTLEWLEHRKKCVTASDWSVILGLNPNKSPLELYQEKIGEKEPEPENDAMRHGTETEPKALERLQKLTGITFKPTVEFHEELPWLMASLDGVDFSGDRIAEVKCPYYEASYRKKQRSGAKNPENPDYAQMQAQMFVTGLKNVIYFVYRNDDEFFCTECRRDDEFIRNALPQIHEFYECLHSRTPPPDKYIDIETPDWMSAAKKLKYARNLAAEAKELEDEAKAEMRELAQGEPAKGAGVKMDVIEYRGSVDYKAIPELQGVNLDQYRKPSAVRYVFKTYEED